MAAGRPDRRDGRRPSISDVAAAARVSKTTASDALRGLDVVAEETRARVLEAADRLGYRRNALAQGLKRRSSGIIGIALRDIANPFYADLVAGITDTTWGEGLTPLIALASRPVRPETGVEALATFQAEALLVAGAAIEEAMIASLARAMPIVSISGTIRHPDVLDVSTDDRLGATLAVRHLIELGHERVAVCHRSDDPAPSRRAKVYEQVMAEAGLASRVATLDTSGVTGEAELAARVAGLLDSYGVPHALFVTNDIDAMEITRILADRGLDVPGDVSVVGYDDIALARTTGLTTVRQDAKAMGKAAAELAMAAISGDGDAASVVFQPELVVRSSTRRRH